MLRKYIEYIGDMFSDDKIVWVLKLIFNLTLSTFNEPYMFDKKVPKDISRKLGEDFELMGLIEFRKVKAKRSLSHDKSKSKNEDRDENAATTFYITKLM